MLEAVTHVHSLRTTPRHAVAQCDCAACARPTVALLQALAAHLLNVWDKTLLFRSCAQQSGCGVGRQLLLLLGIKASCRLSLPVLKENLGKVLRGTGGCGAGLGTTIHLSSAEEVADSDSAAVSGRGVGSFVGGCFNTFGQHAHAQIPLRCVAERCC